MRVTRWLRPDYCYFFNKPGVAGFCH